jgi:hypothetical protein
VSAAPRRPRPGIPFDFWQQFEAAERLEYLRVMRPALYKALPASARASGITW